MQKSMVAAFLLPLLVLIPVSAYAQAQSPPLGENFPSGMTISDDGTEVYVVDNTGIIRLDLSSAFDITSATVHPRQSFTSATTFGVQAVAISNDGNRIFLGTNTFSAPEVVQVPVLASRSIGTPSNPPNCCEFRAAGMTISRDGMWLITGGDGPGIASYELSTAFDISSGVTQNSTSAQPASFHGASISNDGTSLFTINGATVRQYALSTPYVVSSINTTPVDTFDIGISGFIARDMDFSSDGTEMYVLDSGNDLIYQYPLAAPFTLDIRMPDPPDVTITASDGTNDLANGTATSSSSLTFTVQFSEDVTGFADTDIVLSGTADGGNPRIVAGSFTEVNAAQYTFEVIRGFSVGTVIISIDAGAASSVSGGIDSLAAPTFTAIIGPDNTPPTVTISSTQVTESTVTNLVTANFTATFSEPIDASTFTAGDISASGDSSSHSVMNIERENDITYDFQVVHSAADQNISIFVLSGSFEDVNGNANAAASESFQYDFANAPVTPPAGTMPPVIILPIIQSQYVINEELSLQFGQVSGRPAAEFTFPGSPPLAAETNTGSFIWTPNAAGTFSFNVTATNTGGSDTEPIILRVVNSITPFVAGELAPDATFDRPFGDDPNAIQFSNDGLHMFVLESADSDITRYTTITPFDFANTTSDINSDITLDFESSVPRSLSATDLEFSNDGRTMILMDLFSGTLYEYALDAPYVLDPRTQVNTHTLTDLSSQRPTGFTISSDGTKLFAVAGTASVNSQVHEHTLAIPFSVSDVTYNRSLNLGSNPATPQDVAFYNSTAMLVVGADGALHEYAVNPSSISYSGISQTIPTVGPSSMVVADNGLHLFVLDNTVDDIFRYSVVSGSFTTEIDSNPPGATTADGIASFNVEFGNPVTGFDLDDINVASSTGVHVPSNLVMINGTHYTFDVLRGPADATITVMIPANAVGNNMASNSYTVDLEFDFSADYDLSGFEPRTIANTLDIDFSRSGGLMFILNGGDTDTIHRYNLGTDFDITTAPATPDQTFTVTRDPDPRSIEFSADRLKMFVLGADDIIDAYVLDSPFSISPNPVYDGESLSVASVTTNTQGIEFSRDGLYMYVIESGGSSNIFGFPLATAFNVTSGSADNFERSPILADPFSIAMVISDDGTAMYTLGTHNFHSTRVLDLYSFGVAYDVSTLSLVASQPVVNFATRGMTFTPDFESLYIVGNAPQNRIFEYALNTGPPVLEDLDFVFTEDVDVSSSTPIPVSEPDGTVQAFRLESDAPDWMSIGAATGQLSGVVPQDNSPDFRAEDTPARCTIDGSVSFTVTVSDDNFRDINQPEFPDGTLDNVNRTYTVGIMNNERSPNALPTVVDGLGIPIATNARVLDLAMHTSDADAEDILTYSNIRSDVNAAIDSTSLQITSEGLATFRTTGAGGVANISYDVCDGSSLATLMVNTQSAPPALEIIPAQSINEGQTLNSLQLYILSHTESPIDRGTIPVVTGELGIPLSVINFSRVVDLQNLDLQTIQELVASGADPLQFNDTTGVIFIDGFQIVSQTINEETDARTRHTIPDTFVTTGIQSDPIQITYTFALQDGSMFSGIFDITVNKTDAAPISTLPAGYIVDSSDADTTVMLNEFFTDPEGDDIIYTVTNPDPEFADVTITGDILSIDPVSSGIVAAELCATSQATGVPNAATCETITVTVRDIETTESGIFLDSSIIVNHDLLDEDVVLNWDDFAIDPRVAFNHIIITADNADATGEIRINQTDPATLVPELTSNGTTVQIRVFPSNGSGSISYNPTSDFTTPTDSVTFTAVLHGPTIIPSTGVVVGDIIPLVHDSLIVNYTIVTRNTDAAPGELHSGLKFGPRNAVNDRFAIPLNDLFVDNDNSRPRLDVAITAQSNQALSANIVGDRLIVTPPGPGCNCQTRFTFALDDGVNLPQSEQLLFRFESDPTGTVPLGFPQSPVGRLFLPPGFEPFLLNLPDLVARGDAAFAEHVTISNVQLPEDGSGARDNSHITATRLNATHYQIAPGTNDVIGFEFITFDVRFTDDPVDVTVFTSYRLEFDDAPVAQLVLDETPPTVTITSTDVEDRGETTLDVATFRAEFSERIVASTFTEDDITFVGPPGVHMATNVARVNNLVYSFQIDSEDIEANLIIRIDAGAFTDLQGNLNEASTAPYSFTFVTTPTVNVTSDDVEHEGTANLETIRFMAEFSEPVTQFSVDEIIVDSTAPAGTHKASNLLPATGQADTFTFDVQRNGTDGTINVSIPEGAAVDVDRTPHGNAASEVRTATFAAGLPPVIILPVISHQYVVDGPISLQFGLVSGRSATLALDGAPASAAITPGGAFTWTPDTVGNVEFNVVATGPSNTDVEPVTLRIVDDVRTLTLNNTLVFDQTFERSTAGDTPRNVDFSRNGTLMFIMEANDRDITTYSTSGTPFVFANTTGNPNSDIVRGPVAVLPGTTEPSDAEFSNDGRTMFVLGTPRSLHEYSMDSPYDVESLSLVNSHRLTGISGGIVGFTLSSDGTKLFVLGGATSDISVYEFALGVPFSLSDVSSSGASVVLIDAEPRNLTFPNDLAFRSDGTSMFVIGGFAGRFHEYALGAPFSILSGVTYVDNSVAFHPQTGNVNGLRITADNQHMFTLGSSSDSGDVDNVFGFSLPEIIIPTVTINSATPEDATVDGIAAFNATFSESVSGLEASDIIISSSAGVHVVSNFRTDDNTVFDFDVLRGATDAIITVSIPAGAAQNAINVGNTASNTYSVNLILTTPSIDYAPTTSHSGTYSLPTDLAFSSNGTLLFVVETGTNDRILQYDLGTAFDVSSRSDDFTAEFFVGSADNSPNGVEFSNNGQRMFIIGTQNDRIHEYILDAPYAMPSSPTDPDRSFPATGFLPDSFPEGLDFSSDGRYMYMTGAQNDRIFGYELGSPFLLGSITKPPVFSDLTVGRPTGSEITDDGSILYVLDEQGRNGFRNLFVYSLGTAHDVSDLTLLETRPLAGVQLTEMEFGSDSRTLYVTERTGNGILAFAVNTALPELGALNFGFTEDSDVSELAPVPGSDDDPGAVLEYSLSNHPGWLSIDSATGQLSGIVPQDNSPLFDSMDTPARCFEQGSVEFTVTVSDDGFDSDNTDDVSRDYTVSVFNNARSPNDLPSNVNNMDIPLARTATQLDLSLYTSDTDAEDTLTYSFAGLAGNAITPDSLAIDSDTGLATFTSTGNTGTATIDYLVCDGSHLSSLQVTTASATQPSISFDDITRNILVGTSLTVTAQEIRDLITFDAPNEEAFHFPADQPDDIPGNSFEHHNTGRGMTDADGIPDEIEIFISDTAGQTVQNFIGTQTATFIAELRATATSIAMNPGEQAIDNNGVETGDAVVGDVVERASNTFTLVTSAPVIGNHSETFAPGQTVRIPFPITPTDADYTVVLDQDARDMLNVLGLRTGDITNQNPGNLALSGTIPDDIVSSGNATRDFIIPYEVRIEDSETLLEFENSLYIRIADTITIGPTDVLDGGYEIAHSMLGPPDNATFTAVSYMTVIDTGGDLITIVSDDGEGVNEMLRFVMVNEEHTCADLAGNTVTMTTTGTDADGNTAVMTNTIVFGECPSSGSDDSRWKTKATFGTSYTTGLKSVDCGYSMDNTCRDVTDYHVDYLRESIETDSLHDFTLKTSAPNGLRSLGIAFGVPSIGSSLNAAEAQVDVTLERDYTLNSTYKITDVSYTNENSVIGEDAGFSIHKSKCLPSDAESECVTLNIEGVQFREQMYHAPFVIHAMDARGYVTIHYMNDGLLISGDSLNEAPTHDLTAKLAHQRDLAQLSLTRTDKLSDIWTDQFGYTWTKNSYGTWSYVEGPKIVVSPICDDPDKRVCNAFAQKLAAYNVQMEELRDSLYGKAYTMPAFDDLHETLTIQDIDGDSRERFLADNDLLWLLE